MQVCVRGVAARPGMPALGGVLVELGDDGLTLTTTDLEIVVRARVAASGEAGRALVPARVLADLVRNVVAEEVELVQEGPVVRFGGGTASFRLRTLPTDDLPTLPSPPPGIVFELDPAVLRRALCAASRDETRPVMSSVLLEGDDDGLTIVATDDYRLAIVRAGGVAGRFTALVPARAAAEAARMAAPVTVQLGDGGIEFSSAACSVRSRLVDGTFPPYRRLLEGEWAARLVAPREDLLRRVRLVSLLAADEPVMLELEPGRVVVSCRSQAVGEGREELAGEYTGEPMSVLFNPAYLVAGVEAAAGERVVLDLSGPHSRAVIRDDGFTYVVNPIRRS